MKPKFPKVEDIKIFNAQGPWTTKSKGTLSVLLSLSFESLKQYLKYDTNELKKVPEDIRGLRIYTVKNLSIGAVGAGEFHRIREELTFVVSGKVKWTCEDLFNHKKVFTLTEEKGIWTPPFILHTYEVLEDNSIILVMANNLFNPDNPKTHDSYSPEVFHKLFEKYYS